MFYLLEGKNGKTNFNKSCIILPNYLPYISIKCTKCRRKRLLYSRINKNQNSMPISLVKFCLTTSRSKMETSPLQHGYIWPMSMNMPMSKGIYRVIPAVTRIVSFCGLIWKTTPFIHLRLCRPILFKILSI